MLYYCSLAMFRETFFVNIVYRKNGNLSGKSWECMISVHREVNRNLVCPQKNKRKRNLHMRREVSLEEISDGRLYELNDMVKADCQDVQDVMTAVREWGIQLCWIPWMCTVCVRIWEKHHRNW